MAGFIRRSGKPNIEYFARAASQVFTNLALCYFNGSGYLIPADATSGDHLGVVMKTVTAADSDYASAVKIPVDVVGENDIFEVALAAASTVATLTALVGTYIDLSTSVLADATASSKDALLVVGVIDASNILVKITSRVNILRTATT